MQIRADIEARLAEIGLTVIIEEKEDRDRAVIAAFILRFSSVADARRARGRIRSNFSTDGLRVYFV